MGLYPTRQYYYPRNMQLTRYEVEQEIRWFIGPATFEDYSMAALYGLRDRLRRTTQQPPLDQVFP